MKRISLIMGIISLFLFVTVGVVSMATNAHAKPIAMPHSCNAAVQIFPGDGYFDPSFGTIGHGPALIYMDNGDGTFTDCNTKCMWEKKDEAGGGVHDKDNFYIWTAGTRASNGALFTVFLDTLNNTCQNDEIVDCTTNGDIDCAGVGGACGFAGYRDWEIPNVKLLQSIVDYSVFNPSINPNVPGATLAGGYWSSTTFAGGTGSAWVVSFESGLVNGVNKKGSLFARAVRPCS